MKKALVVLGALLLALLPATAQNRAFFGGTLNAYDFAYGWNAGSPAIRVAASSGTCAGGSTSCTLTLDYGYTVTASGIQFQPFNTISPITVGGGTAVETATPSAVACTTPYQQGTCQVTFTAANAHGPGDIVRSGTVGLQEAITTAGQLAYNSQSGVDTDQYTGYGATVNVAADWVQAGGTASMLSSATGLNLVNLFINTGQYNVGQNGYMAWRPNTSSTPSTPSAPTVAVASGGALSTGSGGTYYVTYEYVDADGQLSQYATDSSQQTVTAGNQTLTVTAPAASSGMVGYIPMITAAGGSTGTEIAVPVTSSVCTLTKLESVIPACAITNTSYSQVGSNASIAANPSSTMKVVTSTASLARTGFAYIPVGDSFPLPFSATFAGQNSGAATTATYEIGALNLPSGFFNFYGRKFRLCMEGHTTGAASSPTVQFKLYYGPYNNSDTALVTYAAQTVSATSGTVTLQGCTNLTTTATGATGTLQVHGVMFDALAASSVQTAVGDNQAGAIASLPLSTQQQLRVETTIGTASLGGNVIIDSMSLEPVN